ncbi:MAG: polysaccharide lyase [Hyphomicrobiaceae bacterium]
MRSIKKANPTGLLLNAGAILLVVASAGIVLRSAFVGSQVAPCKERFQSATRFSLESGGAPVSIAQLQGQLASTDWGFTPGARVTDLRSSPSKHVLELDLASAPSVSKEKSAERAGIGFEWSPQSFGRPQAACLSYSVLVPEGFTFGQGGRLPGLYGGSTSGPTDPSSQFSTRYTWTGNGQLDVYSQLPGLSEGRSVGGKVGSFALTPGKWTELEQEVVLNTPGKADGILRVWQNGKLAIEKKDLSFRTMPNVALSGVLAETVAGAVRAGTKRGALKIWLTPFQLNWQ